MFSVDVTAWNHTVDVYMGFVSKARRTQVSPARTQCQRRTIQDLVTTSQIQRLQVSCEEKLVKYPIPAKAMMFSLRNCHGTKELSLALN